MQIEQNLVIGEFILCNSLLVLAIVINLRRKK
jgi:hypothetical protein